MDHGRSLFGDILGMDGMVICQAEGSEKNDVDERVKIMPDIKERCNSQEDKQI